MKNFLIALLCLLLLSGCGMLGGGFGSSDDEALEARISFTGGTSLLQVDEETMDMMTVAFSQVEWDEDALRNVNQSLGGLQKMFEFMEYKVNAQYQLDYATYKVGFEFIKWLYITEIAGVLDKMVEDGDLSDPRDSKLYYFVSKDLKANINKIGEIILLAEKDIRGKASKNDEQRLRELYASIKPFVSLIKAGI